MSVCRKHKRERRLSCNCRTSSTVAGNGYGGPDYTDVSVTFFSDSSSSSSSSDSSSSSGDSGGGGE